MTTAALVRANIKDLLSATGHTKRDLSRAIGKHQTCAQAWFDRGQGPMLTDLDAIAAFFDVPVIYLFKRRDPHGA